MLPKMAAGCLIAAFVTRLLPREVVARVVGAESGLLGILIAMVMGAVLPGGPLTIYPVAGAFLLLGADVGTAIAFITAWNLLGYNRALIWELPFFGPEFVGWRIVVALPLPILAGLLARAVARVPSRRAGEAINGPDRRHQASSSASCCGAGRRARAHGGGAQQGAVPRGLWEGARDFVVLIPRVLIGVVGSGYIAAVMPQDLITAWIGPNSGLLGITIATLVGRGHAGRRGGRLSVGAAALKSGAGAPQVIAYSTAWALYAIHRLINWEIPMMPPRVVWLRAAVSLPLPFLAGHRRDADREAVTSMHRRSAARRARGMMAPRWRITWPARRWAAAAAPPARRRRAARRDRRR